MASQRLRKTRIVCISDTHNCQVKLPPGDVLIHAGDLTNQGSYTELAKTVKWLEAADFEAKIVIAGNHDVTLDKQFYPEHGLYFHNNNPQDPAACLNLLTSSPTITYLCHESKTVRLRSQDGPHIEFTIFGSPYSPRYGLWAFYYDAPKNPSNCSDLTDIWKAIPLNSDIVITHTPPRTHCDETEERRATGCEALRQALWRVRPRLAVCGHIHDGRGASRVTWDLESQNTSYAEKNVSHWVDPGVDNNKLCLVDLIGKKAPPLVNDGSLCEHNSEHHEYRNADHPSPATFSNDSAHSLARLANVGLGGPPNSPRCDQEALLGRRGRQETCVVNAAIMKSRHPHLGGKKLNKPIVVDLYLPVCEH